MLVYTQEQRIIYLPLYQQKRSDIASLLFKFQKGDNLSHIRENYHPFNYATSSITLENAFPVSLASPSN